MRQLLGKQTITVLRPTATQGTNMGISTTTTAVYSNVAASIQPATSSVMVFYAQRQLKVTQTVFVAGDLAMQRGDKITDNNGVNYAVVGWRDLAGRKKVMAIDCEVYQ